MWKLLLSQAGDGSWGASSSTAFALEARGRSETAELKPTLLQRIKEALSAAAAEELEDDRGGAVEAAMQALREGGEGDAAANKGAPRAEDAELVEPEAFAKDDPLTCSPLAIVHSMPAALAALKLASPSIDVTRVWTTLCCCASLQRLPMSWIWGDGNVYADPERTVVDAGREWVERYAAERPELAHALSDGAVHLAAKRTTWQWHRASAKRVAELRRSEAMTSMMGASHLHRASTEIMRALITQVRLGQAGAIGEPVPSFFSVADARASHWRSTPHFQHSCPSRSVACSAGSVRGCCASAFACMHLC